ncbi:hypothetical protein A3Q56_04897 [Intoshia linei]|uniref:Uncharacterized protein n=1 Tax=Intoshia linei TaxID=1819745 RepID=A0A177B1S5_9BILA|nr:hypothetical protein A3Q56_04897 [Intoshia linei]
MIGCYLDEYLNPDDVEFMNTSLNGSSEEKTVLNICLRFRSTLTRRLNSNRQTNGYRIMQLMLKARKSYNGNAVEIIGYVGVVLSVEPSIYLIDYAIKLYEYIIRVDETYSTTSKHYYCLSLDDKYPFNLDKKLHIFNKY